MVKPIKKRVPKSKRDERAAAEAEASGEAGFELDAKELPEDSEIPGEGESDLRAEIKSFANNDVSDSFSEAVEGFFLTLADNVGALIVLALVGLGLYGFIQYNESATLQGQVESRAQLEASQESYQALLNQNATALKARVAAAESNPLGLSIAPQGDTAESPSSSDYKAVAAKFTGLKAKSATAPLAKLAAASASFDAAEASADYASAGRLFSEVGNNTSVETFVRGIALKDAAVAYEEAARSAEEGQRASHWSDAAKAWASLAALPSGVFSLSAKLNRARVLRMSGKLDEAEKLYQELESAYAQSADKARVMRDVKIGRALIAGLRAQTPKTEEAKTEAPKTEAPKTEAPKTEAPKTEAPKTEAPKTEAPKTEAPKTEAPKTAGE